MEATDVIKIMRKHTIVDQKPIVFDIKNSKGCYLHDHLSNSDYLDFLGFSAVNPISFNHPAMYEQQFLEKLSKAALVKPNPVKFPTIEHAEWIETFVRVCGRDYFKHYFFIDVGALAVENALKVAFDWKARKNLENGYDPELPLGIIHFKEAFHGRSGYTLSLTNTADRRKHEYFPKFNWPRITNPKCKFPLSGKNLRDTVALEEKAIQEILSVVESQKNELAALIIEPIQCDGGDNHFRPEFFRNLRKICDENELLFILDEIQTGIAITGKMWAYEHFEVIPDIVCFCKKAQVGGIATTARIDEVDNVFKVPNRIGSTSGGNLVDMVRATRFLQIIEEERLIENAEKMGSYLIDEIQKLAAKYSEKIKNVRGLGLLVAFDFPTKEEKEEFVERCFDKKLLLMIAEPKTIRLRPFLNVGKRDINKMVSIFKNVLNDMH